MPLAISVTEAVTPVLGTRGNRKWWIIANADTANTAYLAVDGTDAAKLTAANGIPLAPGEKLTITLDVNRALLPNPVSAIAAAGKTVDLRVQEG